MCVRPTSNLFFALSCAKHAAIHVRFAFRSESNDQFAFDNLDWCSIASGFYGDNTGRTFEIRPTHPIKAQFSNNLSTIKANLFHRWYIYSRIKKANWSLTETNKRSLEARRDRQARSRAPDRFSFHFDTNKTKKNKVRQADGRLSGMLYEFKKTATPNVSKSVETSINWFFREFPHWIIARVSWRKKRRLFRAIH